MQSISAISDRQRRRGYLGWLLIGATGVILLVTLQQTLIDFRVRHVSWLYNTYDIGVYFESSRWVVEPGALYEQFSSEYPPLANVLFGLVRGLAAVFDREATDVLTFTSVWVSGAWLLYVFCIRYVGRHVSRRALWLWLAPAPLYFALFRYDIYPAAATLLGLAAIRKDKHYVGAVWLGIAIALKGYMLFCLPAYAVYCWHRKGLRTMLATAGICVAPFVISHLVVLAYGGWDAMASPYLAQGARHCNGESTYDAAMYLLNLQGFTGERYDREHALLQVEWLGQAAVMLQIAFALLAAALRPRTFDSLIDAFLVAVVGFATASIFYSPQFILWFIAIACFSSSARLRWGYTAMAWLAYAHFPIFYGKRYFEGVLIVVALLRITLLSSSIVRRWGARRANDHAAP